MNSWIWAGALWTAALFGLVHSQGQDQSQGKTGLAEISGSLDASVIARTWRVKGVMFCPKPCLWVENAYPVGIFEVTRQPFRFDVAPLPGLSKALADKVKEFSSNHSNPQDHSGSSLEFADSRVYTFIPPLEPGFVIAKPKGPVFSVNYISELDALGYRHEFIDNLRFSTETAANCEKNPAHPACAGRWGNFYPRTGFVTRDSEVLSSFLIALRSARAASDPWGRVVLSRYPFEPRVGHYMQLVSPVKRPAVPIGNSKLEDLERGAGAKDGHYTSVHYGIFEACNPCLPPRLVGPRPVK